MTNKFLVLLVSILVLYGNVDLHSQNANHFTDAAHFGFSPEASGVENTKALQKAVNQTGTIRVSRPGKYKIAGTVYLGSNTSLVFDNGVVMQKVNEQGNFTHVLLNKGALTKQYDEHISIEGLNLEVNSVDKVFSEIYGLRGQIAFFYVKDLRIEQFRCIDLASAQFCIHVCTFEDLIIKNVIIKGKKDGIHLGRGKRFTIRDCVFQTFDDAIALNGHDYASSNPELGWIEDGVVENCYDLDAENTTGFFCRLIAGGWIDWKPGMIVQNSDAVVSNGKIYRVQAQPDGATYTSVTQPSHDAGTVTLDGINWGVSQSEATYTSGVRNVTFRDIFLYKARTGFSFQLEAGPYCRSYYPTAPIPVQEKFTFDNIRVMTPATFISVSTPVDVITIYNSHFGDNGITFGGNRLMPDFLTTKINIIGCIFNKQGNMLLIQNNVDNKKILLKTVSSIEIHEQFSAEVNQKNGQIDLNSDLTGLK
jgi:hypothetical protein